MTDEFARPMTLIRQPPANRRARPYRTSWRAAVLITTVALLECRPAAVTESDANRTPRPDSIEAPQRLLGFNLVTEPLAEDASVPGVYDPAIEARIADQLGLDVADISATVTRPADDDGESELHGLRLVIVRLPLDRPIDAIGAYLAEQVTRDGAVAMVENTATGRDRPYSGGGAWSIGHAGDALVIIGLDPAAFEGPTDFSGIGPPGVIAAAFDELIPVPPEPEPDPPRTPEPTAPAESRAPDQAIEARLPTTSLDGQPLNVVSAAQLREGDLGGFGALVPTVLVPHLGVDEADVSMGVAADQDTSMTIWAHRIAGFTGAQLEAAMLGVVMAGPGQGARHEFHGGEVDGRRYTANHSWALFAEDDLLYLLLYFDVGDCFDVCEQPDRQPFLEIIEDTIATIPGP